MALPAPAHSAARPAAVAGVLVVTGVILLACAAGSDKPDTAEEKNAVHGTVRAWAVALADRDTSRSCGLMTQTAQRQLMTLQRSQDCTSAVRQLTDALAPTDRDQLRHIAVLDVTFPESARAIATLGGPTRQLELRKVSGRWLVNDLMTTIRSGGGEYPPPPTSFLPTPPTT